MKRLITFLLLLAATCANAQDIYYWEDSQFVGNLKTNVNKSFSNVVAAIAGISSGGAQSPFTNDIDAAGNSIENLDAPEITNTTIFIRLWGTNVLALQGTTNVALNGVSLMDGPSDGNTPQGPWTNDVAGAGFALTGADYVQATNQAFFVVGTNILAMQGWPDATNVALNGQSLINPGGGSTDWKTRGITNSSEGFACAKIACPSNQLSANTWTRVRPITNVTTDLIYDTGTNYADFAAGFFDETNCTWQMPKGSFLTTGAHTDGAGGGGREMWMALWVNGQPLTNYNSMPIHNAGGEYSDVYSTLSQSGYAAANAGIFLVTWSKMFYNTTATNIWELRIRDGGANYDYSCWLEVRYMGDQR